MAKVTGQPSAALWTVAPPAWRFRKPIFRLIWIGVARDSPATPPSAENQTQLQAILLASVAEATEALEITVG